MTKVQQSTPLVAIHLSDIHFGQERGEDTHINEDARGQLVKAVTRIAAGRRLDGRPPISSIIITGDIAYSGQKEQFDRATRWLAEVSEAAGSDPVAVQVVPGNHDVDRGSSDFIRDFIRKIIAGGRALLHKSLNDPQENAILYKRLDAYQEFASGYGCTLDTKGGYAGSKDHVLAPGKRLRILGLNSALICDGSEATEKPQLLLGARQRMIPDDEDVEYIVLIHHPMHWLADGEDAWTYIGDRARILMCGHEHTSNVRMRRTPGGGEILVIDAGATVPDKVTSEHTYTFNVVEIDLAAGGDAIEITVDTYKWATERPRFEQDTSNHENGRPRVITLPCPKFSDGGTREPGEAPPDASDAEAVGRPTEDRAESIGTDTATYSSESPERTFAQARSEFFHELTIPQRVEVLVKLRALPDNGGDYSASIMMRQLDRLNAGGRMAELSAAIAEVRRGDRREDGAPGHTAP